VVAAPPGRAAAASWAELDLDRRSSSLAHQHRPADVGQRGDSKQSVGLGPPRARPLSRAIAAPYRSNL
jgi:hypothetical protein